MNSMSHDTIQFLLHYWQDLGTPLALKLHQCLLDEDWELMERIIGTIKPENFAGRPRRFRKVRAAVDIIKKADYLPIYNEDTRQAVAYLTWVAAEKKCGLTNRILNEAYSPMAPLYMPLDKRRFFEVLLPRAADEVKRIMGSYPKYEFLDFFGGFGPGATLSNKRREASVLHKLNSTPTITRDAEWFYPALPKRLRSIWGRVDQLSQELAGRLQFVPKNYKTDRPIMVEPLINASIQRFLGKYIRKRLLLTTGIDLSVAPELHKKLACEGSFDGNWATIDLQSASDTIAYELVKFLLPEDWFRVFDAARTKWVDLGEAYDWFNHSELLPEDLRNYIKEPLHVLRKFSSMGNGFTFELETMIFYAFAKVAADETNSEVGGVFGDDIIVGTPAANLLIQMLTLAGFAVNSEKSYLVGDFRESCGGDFMIGYDVKAVTLKKEPKSVWDWYDLHNRLWTLSRNWGLYLEPTLKWIRKRVPKAWRLSIPKELGGGGFFSDKPPKKTIDGITYYRCLVPTTRYMRGWEEHFTPEVQLAAGLLGGVASNSKGRLQGPPLLDVKSCKLAWVPLS